MGKKMCERCGNAPASVPDRNRMGRQINRICAKCHAGRIQSDLVRILTRSLPEPPKEETT